MNNQELHTVIRHKLRQIEPSFEPQHWANMAALLEANEPQQANDLIAENRSRRAYLRPLAWAGLSAAACLAAVLLVWLYVLPAQKEQNVASSQIPPVSIGDFLNFEESFNTKEKAKRGGARRFGNQFASISSMDSIYGSAPTVFVDAYNPSLFSIKKATVLAVPSWKAGVDFLIDDISLESVTEVELVYSIDSNTKREEITKLQKQVLAGLFNQFPYLLENASLRLVEQNVLGSESQESGLFSGLVFHHNGGHTVLDATQHLAKSQLKPLHEKQPKWVDPITAKLAQQIRSQFSYWRDSISDSRMNASRFAVVKPSVVVFDWSPSMHMHVSEATRWLHENMGNPKIQGYVFFNDCDEEGVPISHSNKQGAMYVAKPGNFEEILETMLKAARYGMANHDWYENDFNAIDYAMKSFPDAEEIILVADNKSNVRDTGLITGFDKPVRVILCGTTFVKPYHPDYDFLPIKKDYLSLVERTNGSMHVIENDRFNLAEPANEHTVLSIEGKSYKYSETQKRWEKIQPVF